MQHPLRALRWIFVAVFGLVMQNAWAGRPFSTEDAGVIEKGHCEVEAFGVRLRPPGGPTENGLSAQLGCGVIGRTQLALALEESKAAGEKNARIAAVGQNATGRWRAEQAVVRGGLLHSA